MLFWVKVKVEWYIFYDLVGIWLLDKFVVGGCESEDIMYKF